MIDLIKKRSKNSAKRKTLPGTKNKTSHLWTDAESGNDSGRNQR